MTTISILALLLITITSFAFAQDAPNKLDVNGKKIGKWLIHLDKDWKRVDDPAKGFFTRLPISKME